MIRASTRRWLVALLALTAAPVRAQGLFLPSAPSAMFDTSIRAAAMGGAGAAVTWGEPGVWANPATLAGVRGVGWVTGRTRPFPGDYFFGEMVFSSQRLLLGGGGVGVSLMGQPISGLGKAQFDYGSGVLPGARASAIGGRFGPPVDKTKGWGVGVSPLRLIESIGKLARWPARSLTTYGDVTLGYQSEASKFTAGSFSDEEGVTYDWGVSGRLALARWWGADAPFRLDLSGAWSKLNTLQSGSQHGAPSATQINRTGVALHLSPAPPSERSASPPSLPWWRPGEVPEFSVGLAYDHDQMHDVAFGPQASSIDHYGFEANVFRLLALRVGYLTAPFADVEGWSYGGGVTLPVGPWGSVGYQFASVPTMDDFDRPLRQGWTVWLDPTRFFVKG